MKHICYPRAVCSRRIGPELRGGAPHNVVFTGGRDGSLSSLVKLAGGMDAGRAATRPSGNDCRGRSASRAPACARGSGGGEEAATREQPNAETAGD